MANQDDVKNTPPRAVVYLRFATPDRIGKRTAAARQACQRRVGELGAVVVRDYADTGSGLTGERPQLTQMLNELVSAGIAYVIVPDHASIARNMQVYGRIVWTIEQAGARLIVASAPLEEYPGMQSNPLGLQQAVADWADNETGTSTDREVGHD